MKKRTGYTMCFIFAKIFVQNIFRSRQYRAIHVEDERRRAPKSSYKLSVTIVRLQQNLEFVDKFGEKKRCCIKFYENPFYESRVITCVRTDGRTDGRSDSTNKVSSNALHI